MKRNSSVVFSALLTAILFLEWIVPPSSAFALRAVSTRESAGLEQLRAGLEESDMGGRVELDEEALLDYAVRHPVSQVRYQQGGAGHTNRKNLNAAMGEKRADQVIGAVNDYPAEIYVVPDHLIGGQGAWRSAETGTLYFGQQALGEREHEAAVEVTRVKAAIANNNLNPLREWVAQQRERAAEMERARAASAAAAKPGAPKPPTAPADPAAGKKTDAPTAPEQPVPGAVERSVPPGGIEIALTPSNYRSVISHLVRQAQEGIPGINQTVSVINGFGSGDNYVTVDVTGQPDFLIDSVSYITHFNPMPIMLDPRSINPAWRRYNGSFNRETVFNEMFSRQPAMARLVEMVQGDMERKREDPAWLREVLQTSRRVLEEPVEGKTVSERLQAILGSYPDDRRPAVQQGVEAVQRMEKEVQRINEVLLDSFLRLRDLADGEGEMPLDRVRAEFEGLFPQLELYPRVQLGALSFLNGLPPQGTVSSLAVRETFVGAQNAVRTNSIEMLSQQVPGWALAAVYYEALRAYHLGELPQLEQRLAEAGEDLSERLKSDVAGFSKHVTSIEIEWAMTESVRESAVVETKPGRPSPLPLGGCGVLLLDPAGQARLVPGGGVFYTYPMGSIIRFPVARVQPYYRPGDRVVLMVPSFTGYPTLDQLDGYFESWLLLQKNLPGEPEVWLGVATADGATRLFRPIVRQGAVWDAWDRMKDDLTEINSAEGELAAALRRAFMNPPQGPDQRKREQEQRRRLMLVTMGGRPDWLGLTDHGRQMVAWWDGVTKGFSAKLKQVLAACSGMETAEAVWQHLQGRHKEALRWMRETVPDGRNLPDPIAKKWFDQMDQRVPPVLNEADLLVQERMAGGWIRQGWMFEVVPLFPEQEAAGPSAEDGIEAKLAEFLDPKKLRQNQLGSPGEMEPFARDWMRRQVSAGMDPAAIRFSDFRREGKNWLGQRKAEQAQLSADISQFERDAAALAKADTPDMEWISLMGRFQAFLGRVGPGQREALLSAARPAAERVARAGFRVSWAEALPWDEIAQESERIAARGARAPAGNGPWADSLSPRDIRKRARQAMIAAAQGKKAPIASAAEGRPEAPVDSEMLREQARLFGQREERLTQAIGLLAEFPDLRRPLEEERRVVRGAWAVIELYRLAETPDVGVDEVRQSMDRVRRYLPEMDSVLREMDDALARPVAEQFLEAVSRELDALLTAAAGMQDLQAAGTFLTQFSERIHDSGWVAERYRDLAARMEEQKVRLRDGREAAEAVRRMDSLAGTLGTADGARLQLELARGAKLLREALPAWRGRLTSARRALSERYEVQVTALVRQFRETALDTFTQPQAEELFPKIAFALSSLSEFSDLAGRSAYLRESRAALLKAALQRPASVQAGARFIRGESAFQPALNQERREGIGQFLEAATAGGAMPDLNQVEPYAVRSRNRAQGAARDFYDGVLRLIQMAKTGAGLEEAADEERRQSDGLKRDAVLRPGDALVLEEQRADGAPGERIEFQYVGRTGERADRANFTVMMPRFRMVINGLILEGKRKGGMDWVGFLKSEWPQHERFAKKMPKDQSLRRIPNIHLGTPGMEGGLQRTATAAIYPFWDLRQALDRLPSGERGLDELLRSAPVRISVVDLPEFGKTVAVSIHDQAVDRNGAPRPYLASILRAEERQSSAGLEEGMLEVLDELQVGAQVPVVISGFEGLHGVRVTYTGKNGRSVEGFVPYPGTFIDPAREVRIDVKRERLGAHGREPLNARVLEIRRDSPSRSKVVFAFDLPLNALVEDRDQLLDRMQEAVAAREELQVRVTQVFPSGNCAVRCDLEDGRSVWGFVSGDQLRGVRDGISKEALLAWLEKRFSFPDDSRLVRAVPVRVARNLDVLSVVFELRGEPAGRDLLKEEEIFRIEIGSRNEWDMPGLLIRLFWNGLDPRGFLCAGFDSPWWGSLAPGQRRGILSWLSNHVDLQWAPVLHDLFGTAAASREEDRRGRIAAAGGLIKTSRLLGKETEAAETLRALLVGAREWEGPEGQELHQVALRTLGPDFLRMKKLLRDLPGPSGGLEEDSVAMEEDVWAKEAGSLSAFVRQRFIRELTWGPGERQRNITKLRQMALEDDSIAVRLQAVQALRNAGYRAKPMVQLLLKFVEEASAKGDWTFYVRQQITAALVRTVRMAPAACMPLIREAEGSPNADVSGTAAQVRTRVEGRQKVRVPARPPEGNVSLAPQHAIAKVNRPPPVSKKRKVSPAVVRKMAGVPLKELERTLEVGGDEERLEAARELGQRGPEDRAELERIARAASTDDESPEVRTAASVALQKIRQGNAGLEEGGKRPSAADIFASVWSQTGVAAAYDRAWDNEGTRRVHRTLISGLGDITGQTVIEIGCGTGIGTEVLSKAVGPAGRVIAVDSSEEMLGWAAQRSYPHPNVEFRVEDGTETTGASGKLADGIVLFNGVHLLKDPVRAFSAWSRHTLRPGGWIAFNISYGIVGVSADEESRRNLEEARVGKIIKGIQSLRPEWKRDMSSFQALSAEDYLGALDRAGFVGVSARFGKAHRALSEVIAGSQIPGVFDAVYLDTGLSLDEQRRIIAKAAYEAFDEQGLSELPVTWLHATARKPAAGLEEQTVGWVTFRDKDPGVRREAADRLIRQGVAGIPVILDVCAANLGPAYREEAIRALREITIQHPGGAVDALLKALDERSGWKRPCGAALALAELDTPLPEHDRVVAALRGVFQPETLKARENELLHTDHTDLIAEHLTWGGNVFTAVVRALVRHDPQGVDQAISNYEQASERYRREPAGKVLDQLTAKIKRELEGASGQGGLEEADLAERVGEAVQQINGNVVVALDAALFDPATAARLADPADTTLIGLWMKLRDEVLPWPAERSADLQIIVVAPEGRQAVLAQYEGWRVVEVGRRPGTSASPLPVAALPRVVAEALASGAGRLEIDVTPYLDLGNMTLDEALEDLRRLIFA